VSQQYAAAATVPLIKSPSLWMPKPVCLHLSIGADSQNYVLMIQIELPNDVHPLPEDITAYVSHHLPLVLVRTDLSSSTLSTWSHTFFLSNLNPTKPYLKEEPETLRSFIKEM